MPDIRVQDEQGNIHVFPDAATPEMIAGALNVKPPSQEMPIPNANAQARATALRPLTYARTGSDSYLANTSAPPTSQEQENQRRQVSSLMPQVPGVVSGIRNQALQAGGAAFGGELAGPLGRGLPWATRALARASGAGLGAGVGNLTGGGSPKDALATAGQFAATAAPLEGVAEGASAARGALRDASYKEFPTNGPQLNKGASRVGRAAGTVTGGGIGAALPIPGAATAGGIAGFELGPSMLERVLGTPELGTTRNPGPFSKLPARVPAGARTDPLATGPSTAPAKSPSGVSLFPEPRNPMPWDKPGAMWSVGREKTLPQAAQRGAPGAADVLRNTGKPIIYTPKEGVGYPGPRPNVQPPAEVPQKPMPWETQTPTTPTPQFTGGGINMKGVEASNVQMSPEDTMTSLSTEIGRMNTTLRNSAGRPAAERAALQAQINEYQQRLDELRGPGKRLPWMKPN